MFKKALEEKPRLICLLSIFFFLFFLVWFDREVAVVRIHDEQITSYLPGDRIPHIHSRYFGITPTGQPLIRDDYGSRLKINAVAEYPIRAPMILAGRVGQDREFILEEMEVFPDIKLKIIVSIVAVLLMFVALIPNIRVTFKGLELKVKNCQSPD